MVLLAVLLSLGAGLLLGFQLGKVRGESAEDAAERREWAEWRRRFYADPPRPKPGRGQREPHLVEPMRQGAEPPPNGTPVIWHPPHPSSTMSAPPSNYSAGVHGRWLNG